MEQRRQGERRRDRGNRRRLHVAEPDIDHGARTSKRKGTTRDCSILFEYVCVYAVFQIVFCF